MTKFPSSLTSNHTGCQGCQHSEPLGFDFDFAYQPIVDLRNQSVFAHEALVRGVRGEGALTVLDQVTEDNRYRSTSSAGPAPSKARPI